MTDTADNTLFSVSASRLVRPFTRRKLISAAPVAVIIVIAGAWGAMYDVRYIFPALIMLFVLWAAMTTWAWLAIIGDRQVAQLTRPQRWIYSGGECTVELFRFPVPAQDNEQEQEAPELYSSFTFRPEQVVSVQLIDSDMVLYLDRKSFPQLRYLVISQRNMPPHLEQDIYNSQDNLSS